MKQFETICASMLNTTISKQPVITVDYTKLHVVVHIKNLSKQGKTTQMILMMTTISHKIQVSHLKTKDTPFQKGPKIGAQ